MMVLDSKRLNKAAEILSRRSVDRALKARAVNRQRDSLLAEIALSEVANRRWYALKVTKGDEIVVDKVLRDAGVECWLPLKKKEFSVGHTAKKRVSNVPIFPGILLVRVVWSGATWHGLKLVDGVRTVFGTADKPLPMSEREVSKFKGFCEKGLFDEKAADGFVPGAKVRVATGLMMGDRGTVISHRRSRKDRVWLQLFGGVGVIEMPLAILEIDD